MRLPLLIPVGFPPFFPAGIFFCLHFLLNSFLSFSKNFYVNYRHFMSVWIQLFSVRYFTMKIPAKKQHIYVRFLMDLLREI